MTVSVVIPAYRAETFIARAVSSVLAQTLQDFEIVIVSDDGKDYIAILDMQGICDSRIRCVSTGGTRTGISHARNCALDAANHRIIVSLDADDELLPDHLKRMREAAMAYGVAISQVDFVDQDNGAKLSNRAKPYAEGLLPLEDAFLVCLHTYAPVAFDRQKIGHRWNEAVPLLEDAVFLAQCCDIAGSVWYGPEPTYRYYHRKDSQCNATDAAARFMEAGSIILALLHNKKIMIGNPHIHDVLQAFIEKNNRLEMAFAKALAAGEARDYQDFIAKNITLLHAPLI